MRCVQGFVVGCMDASHTYNTTEFSVVFQVFVGTSTEPCEIAKWTHTYIGTNAQTHPFGVDPYP